MARGFSTTVESDLTALKGPLATLRRLQVLGHDLTPFMRAAESILVSSVFRRFDKGVGPDNIPWEPSRRALGLVKGKRPGKTLVDTSELRDSVRGEYGENYAIVGVAAGSKGENVSVKARANQFGSHREDVYVKDHTRRQTYAFGAPIANPKEVSVQGHYRVTNLPARPFIGIDKADTDLIRETWREIILELVKTDG